jgi:hypothetical protein
VISLCIDVNILYFYIVTQRDGLLKILGLRKIRRKIPLQNVIAASLTKQLHTTRESSWYPYLWIAVVTLSAQYHHWRCTVWGFATASSNTSNVKLATLSSKTCHTSLKTSCSTSWLANEPIEFRHQQTVKVFWEDSQTQMQNWGKKNSLFYCSTCTVHWPARWQGLNSTFECVSPIPNHATFHMMHTRLVSHMQPLRFLKSQQKTLSLWKYLKVGRPVGYIIYIYIYIWYMIYLLTATGLTPGGSTTVHTHKQVHITTKKQTIHRTTQKCNWNSAGRAPSWRVIPWHLPYDWGKSTEKPQSG